MAKKVIQVPMDVDLLEELDKRAQMFKQTRAETIRTACRDYLRAIEREEKDRAYQRGYEKHPESTDIGEAQSVIAGDMFEEESW